MHIWLRAALHSVDAHWSDHEKSIKCCWPKVTTNSRRSMTQIYSTAYVFNPSWLQKSISDICTFLLNYSYRAKTMSRKISCGNIWLKYNYYWDDFYEEKMFFCDVLIYRTFVYCFLCLIVHVKNLSFLVSLSSWQIISYCLLCYVYFSSNAFVTYILWDACDKNLLCRGSLLHQCYKIQGFS